MFATVKSFKQIYEMLVPLGVPDYTIEPYVCSPGVDKIKYNDRLIFQKFLVISVFRFKRGLVYLPDTE